MRELVDQVFQNTIRRGMYTGIEATMSKETVMTAALVLSVYTEILGGFVTGKLREESSSGINYHAFLRFLGDHYVQLDNELRKRGTSLYKEVRSKIVHEFQPRPGFALTFEDEVTEKPGLEYASLGDAPYSSLKDRSLNYPARRFLIFRIREYYRDFQNAVNRYELEIKSETGNSFPEGSLMYNFMKCLTYRVGDF